MQPKAQGMVDCSFLQVTINSNKLMQILQKLMRQVNDHETQIKTMKEVLPNIKKSVVQNLQTLQNKQKLDYERLELKIREQIKFTNTHILSVDEQVEKNKGQSDRKFNECEAIIFKMEEQKNRIQSIINIHHQSHTNMERSFTEQLLTLKQNVQKAQKQISQSDSNIQMQLEMMMLKVQALIRKSLNRTGDANVDKISRKSSIVTFKQKQNKNLVATFSNFSNFASSPIEEEDQANRNQTNSIINSPKKQVHSTKNLNKTKKHHKIFDEQQSLANSRHHKIEVYNQEQIKSIQILKNKSIIQEEKLQIMGRKIQKINHFLGQFKQICKKIQEKKTDEQVIQSLKSQIRKMHMQLSQDLDRKLYKQLFDKQKQRILQKIVILQQNLTQKTDKSDMKKAFIFMEEKIKQMIILIAGDQNDEKDGAIKKMPVKCLSCDKGLQTQKNTPARLPSPLTQRQNQASSRNLSKKVRKRIHYSNQNSSTDI